MPAKAFNYKPEYAEMILEHFKNGGNLIEFANAIGVCKMTLRNWAANHDDFREAWEKGKKLVSHSKYDERFLDLLIDHMKLGLSFESFAGAIGVSSQTIDHWRETDPDFREAVEIGRMKNLLHHEKALQACILGSRKNMNINALKFSMTNQHGQTYNEKQKHEITGKDGEALNNGSVVQIMIPDNGRDGYLDKPDQNGEKR